MYPGVSTHAVPWKGLKLAAVFSERQSHDLSHISCFQSTPFILQTPAAGNRTETTRTVDSMFSSVRQSPGKQAKRFHSARRLKQARARLTEVNGSRLYQTTLACRVFDSWSDVVGSRCLQLPHLDLVLHECKCTSLLQINPPNQNIEDLRLCELTTNHISPANPLSGN